MRQDMRAHTHTLKGNTGTGAGATAGKVHIMFPLNIISQREPRMQMLPKLESFHLIYLFIYFLHSFIYLFIYSTSILSSTRVSKTEPRRRCPVICSGAVTARRDIQIREKKKSTI